MQLQISRAQFVFVCRGQWFVKSENKNYKVCGNSDLGNKALLRLDDKLAHICIYKREVDKKLRKQIIKK